MKQNQRRWSKDEILIAINLYHQLPFANLRDNHPMIIRVAQKMGRTPSALVLKIGNLGILDASLPHQGLRHFSQLDREVWEAFQQNPEDAIFASESLLNPQLDEDFTKRTTEAQRLVKTRVNQDFFRKTVLAAYESRCCISGVNDPNFLIASHIIPWRDDEKNRLNLRNALCLNVWFDRAFDRGLMTLDEDFRVCVSAALLANEQAFFQQTFRPIVGQQITLPQKFLPDPALLRIHREQIFQP